MSLSTKIKFLAGSAGLVVGVTTVLVFAQESLPDLQESPQVGPAEYSYAIGLEIGSNFQADGLDLDVESLMAGLKDGLSSAEPKYDETTLRQAFQHLSKVKMQAMIAQNKQFLEENKKKEGVKVTPSGLQIKVLKSGTGPSPEAGDTVRTHYRGQLIDGTEFDSSYARDEPAEFPVEGVIPGWTEALKKMKVGDKWQLVIPSNLAYGERGAGEVIPPGATLVFEIELLEIVE